MSWHRLPAQLPLVLGHRGARARAPENTLVAFERALADGAAGVELDVRLERTGEVIVLHDRTLTRVTGERDRRDVEHCRHAELARVDVGGGAAIPRLEEVIAWAERSHARVNVELKSDVTHRQRLVARTVALLARAHASPDQFLLSSFHPGMVRLATRLAAAWMSRPVPVALLVEPASPHCDTHPTWRQLGAAGVHPAAALATTDRIARWQSQRALVNVWTVNDAARARQLVQCGVDAIITDDPATIVPALL